jgi:hypothetical protein
LEDRTLLSISISGLPSWAEAGPRPIHNIGTAAPPDFAVGAIQSIAVDPNHPSNVWVGTTNGGVWRTTNADINNPGAITWTPLMDRLPSLAIGSVAVDPLDSSGKTVWAGTGNFSNGGVNNGPTPPALANGLWRTTDGGVTWVPLGQNIITWQRVEKVLPTGILNFGKELVLVATTDGGGLFRSTDGGATFNAEGTVGGANGLPNGASVADLIQDPNHPGTFYATVWGPEMVKSGIYKSTNQGNTWQEIDTAPMNITPSSVVEIAAGGAANPILYAAVANPDPGNPFGDNRCIITGVFTSTDGGTTWGQLPSNPQNFDSGNVQAAAPFSMIADPLAAHVAYLAGQEGSWFRFDPTSGSWVGITGGNARSGTTPHVDNHDMAFLPPNLVPETLLEADDGGIYYLTFPRVPMVVGWQSFDGNLGNVEFYQTALDTNADLVFGGAQDNGISVQSQLGSQVWNGMGGGDGGAVAYDALGNVRYGLGSNFGDFTHNGTPVQLSTNGVLQLVTGTTTDTTPGPNFGDIIVSTFSTQGLKTGEGVRIAGVVGNDAANGVFTVNVLDGNDFELEGVKPDGAYAGGGIWTQVGLNKPDLATVTTSPGFIRSPFATNPAAANRLLFAGLTGVYESFDRGDIITDISGTLPNLMPNTSTSGAPHYALLAGGFQTGQAQPNVAYVGTDQGQFYFRGPTASTFTEVDDGPTVAASPGQLQSFGKRIWSIAADPLDWRRVYVVLDNDTVFTSNNVTDLANNPFTPILYNLKHLTSNLRSIAIYDVSTKPGNVVPLVGALDGVYRLLGTSWTKYGANFPNVLALDVSHYGPSPTNADQILAGTYGRGAWQLVNPFGTIATPTVLQINGDTNFPGEDDVIKLALDPSNPTLLNVFLNSATPSATFELSTIQQINVNGLGGNNRTIVDFTNGLFSIPQGINVTGGSGNNQLQVIDPLPLDSIQITGNSVTVDGTLSQIFYSGQAGLEVDTAGGVNVTVVSTGTAAVTVKAGAGNDVFNVALSGVQAAVAMDGQGNTGQLFLNDQGNPTSTEYDITATSVARFTTALLPTISYSNIAALTLNGGSGTNSYFVETTAAKTPVFVNTGAGNDTIELGFFESLGGFQAPVAIQGQGGTDQLFLNDKFNSTAMTYFVSSTSIVRTQSPFLPSVSITYSQLAGLTLNPGSAANTVTVTDTSTPVTVNTGTGNDTVTLGDSFSLGHFFQGIGHIRALINVNGQGGTNQVVLGDFGNGTTADQLTATGSGVTSDKSGSFFGPGGSVTYSGVGNVTINSSNAAQGDTITVYPASAMEFVVNGDNPTTPPGDSLIVEPLTNTVLTQHSTGTGAGFYTLPGSTTQLVSYTGIETVTPVGLLAVGVDAGHAPDLKVYDAQSNTLKYDLHPFSDDFRGGVRVAVGDVNGDGIPDIVTAEGDGGGTVQVFDGATGQPLAGPLGSFTPFGPDYHHGLWVAAADVNGDGYADIVVGEDAGGQPRVRVFSGKDGSLLADFLAFDPSFHGGVRVAAADFNHDHHADIVAGQGPGGQAINVFEGATLSPNDQTPAPAFSIPQPFAAPYDQDVYVATGDVFGDGTPKILVSQGAGRDPAVAVFDGAAAGKQLENFVVRGFRDGARVAAADINGDGRSDIIVAAVHGDSVVRGFDGLSLQEDGHFTVFGAAYHGGVFVGGFGHWGDFANLSGRKLSGPQGALQTALADLTTSQAGLTNSDDSRRLAGALDLLYTAFNSPAWIDSSDLQAGIGLYVFAEEEAAVRKIAELIQHNQGAVPGQQLEDDLRLVAVSDEELAQLAMASAQDNDSTLVRAAKAALLKGQNDLAAAFAAGGFDPGRLEDALDHFRLAWEDAL